MQYRIDEDAPPDGATVRFWVFQPSAGGEAPIANYRGTGEYLGKAENGFAVRVVTCTSPEVVGQTISVLSIEESS